MILPLNSPKAALANAGGKGANLSILSRAGFPVPDGFLITTEAYREFVAANHLGTRIQAELVGIRMDDPAALQTASKAIRACFARACFARACFRAGIIPAGELIREEYIRLGSPPVAVRSSATAEDLPDMSFAGQQDTFLNVIGEEVLLEAVVNCWSSLWTARAIGYRARNDIPHEDVALSVVVQKMVQSEVSGVLFTANPLNGIRAQTVIDATLGLGEALVGGHVEPDHYVVDVLFGEIVGKSLGSKLLAMRSNLTGGLITIEEDASQQQALPDEQIFELAQLGQKVAAVYDFPQDIEWAWANGKLYLLQSRPITSLFPLPEGMGPDPLKVMIGFHTIQGILEPLTPLGQNTMQLVLAGASRVFGLEHTHETQTAVLPAGERLWINVTPIIRHPIGHKIYPNAIKAIDPGVAQALQELVEDPRLAPERHGLHLATVRRVTRFIFPTLGRIRRLWHDPDGERARITRLMDTKVAETQARLTTTGNLWADFALRMDLLHEAKDIFPDTVIPNGVTAVVAGMVPFFGVLQRFSAQAAEAEQDPQLQQLYLEITRGLPHNVTTEMDLALWQTAQTLRADPVSEQVFRDAPASALADRYLAGTLPLAAQEAVAAFMQRYGIRGVGEIDIGRPRWREKPAYVMQMLQSYLQIEDEALAPDVVFARGAEASQAAGVRLETAIRKTRRGRVKARLVRWAVRRYRALAGIRESPKFFAIRMMGILRQGLLESGQAFAEAGLLEQPDDLFFLYIRELDQIRAQKAIPAKFRERIAARRALRAREMLRRQIPRVLLSDGRAFYEGIRAPAGEDDGAIVGDPVSPGVVEGVVRVVLDPYDTQLQPGEILVCPGTDPAWTPLFLAAGGLVMEVGGMMTHGSVVAREYGIPAVVGVHEATTRLKTGMRVRVDGSGGRVEVVVGS